MRVSNAPNTPVSGEKPGFQSLSKGLIVLLCAEVVKLNGYLFGFSQPACNFLFTPPPDGAGDGSVEVGHEIITDKRAQTVTVISMISYCMIARR